MKKVFFVVSFFLILPFLFAQNASAAVNCEWTTLNNPGNPNNGKLALCVGGFTSQNDLKSHSLRFSCQGSNPTSCGGLGSRFWSWLTNSSANNVFSMASTTQFITENDQISSCYVGQFDSSVTDVAKAAVDKTAAGCVGFSVANLFTPAGLVLKLGGDAAACAGIAKLFAFSPTINAEVLNNSGQNVCSKTLPVTVDSSSVLNREAAILSEEQKNQQQNPGNTGPQTKLTTPPPFSLCDQIPTDASGNDGNLRAACKSCVTQGGGSDENPTGIYTAVGCIPTKRDPLIKALLTIGLGLGGGFALLRIIAAGFTLSTSGGEPKKASEAKEMITSSVIGLLFILFSVTILQFVGVTILQIPGLQK